VSATRILFVDDDAELREIVISQLTGTGYSVDEAEDGIVAIEKLEKENFDLVLLDIKMPGKTGLDVLQHIKDRSLSCRVIMLTGVVGMGTAIESLSMGADDYLTKPYKLEQLLSSIKRVMQDEGA